MNSIKKVRNILNIEIECNVKDLNIELRLYIKKLQDNMQLKL